MNRVTALEEHELLLSLSQRMSLRGWHENHLGSFLKLYTSAALAIRWACACVVDQKVQDTNSPSLLAAGCPSFVFLLQFYEIFQTPRKAQRRF